MRGQVRDYVDYSFKKISDGWHTFEVIDGIAVKVNEKTGSKSLLIPFQVNEEGSEDHGLKLNLYCPFLAKDGSPSKFGEQRAVDVIALCGLKEKFENKFPGDVSPLDDAIITGMQTQLPGKFIRMKTEISKDENVNVVAMASLKTDLAKHDKHYGKPAAAEAPKATAKTKADDWD
jgi:hypothetical protein